MGINPALNHVLSIQVCVIQVKICTFGGYYYTILLNSITSPPHYYCQPFANHTLVQRVWIVYQLQSQLIQHVVRILYLLSALTLTKHHGRSGILLHCFKCCRRTETNFCTDLRARGVGKEDDVLIFQKRRKKRRHRTDRLTNTTSIKNMLDS